MINRTKEEILAKVNEMWPAKPTDQKISIEIGHAVFIEITKMYDPPGLTFKQLMELSQFFDTENIDDADRINEPGCETCDYGSCYGFRLKIW